MTGAAIALSGAGAALVTAGSRVRRGVILAASVVPLVWAGLDLVLGGSTSPTSVLGAMALWPLHGTARSVGGPVMAAALVWYGWRRVAYLSLERVRDRSRLVAQIRFALAQQDIRSLLILRRRLAAEAPRGRPWFSIAGGGWIEERVPVAVRDARSYARWPLTRIVRVAALAVVAGIALATMWHGTTASIGLVGASFYLAAIEVIEPLSQELDHPSILELVPVESGRIMLAHALTAVVAMLPLWLIAGVTAVATTLDGRLGLAIAVAAVPASAIAVAAAGFSIRRADSPSLIAPVEGGGGVIVYRLLWPPALTTAGALPVLFARNAVTSGADGPAAAVNTAAVMAIVASVAVGWLRYRDRLSGFAPAADQAG